jgi:hypothetical protein
MNQGISHTKAIFVNPVLDVHIPRASWLFAKCVASTINASSNILEWNLVFPRNERYVPTDRFPIVSAFQNSLRYVELGWPFRRPFLKKVDASFGETIYPGILNFCFKIAPQCRICVGIFTASSLSRRGRVEVAIDKTVKDPSFSIFATRFPTLKRKVGCDEETLSTYLL